MRYLRLACLIGSIVASLQCEDVQSPPPVESALRAVPDQQRASSAEIGPAGGSVTVQTQDGLQLTLSIPAGALGADTMVTVSPLLRFDGLPEGVSMVFGVQLSPEGLTLWKPATLEIPLPASAKPERLFAFGWERAGRKPCLLPVARATDGADVARVGIFHFSGAALGQAADGAAIAGWEGGGSDEYLARLAALYRHAEAAGILPWYDGMYQALFSQLVVDWFSGPIRDALQTALAAPLGAHALDAAEDVGRECAKWRAAIYKWEFDYFLNRPAAPLSWSGPLRYLDWDNRYETLGLSSNVAASVDQAVIAINQIIERGTRDQACQDEPNVCARRAFVEHAILWIELASHMTGISAFHGVKVTVPRPEEYCDRYALTRVTEIAIFDMQGGSPSAIELTTGESYQLLAAATSLLGQDLSHLAVWQSSNPSVVVVDEGGRLSALSTGSATVTLSDADECVTDQVQVGVVDPNRTVVLRGTVTLSGEWLNGCNENCNTSCPPGIKFWTGYSGSYDIEITIQSLYGTGGAAAEGHHTTSHRCMDGVSPIVSEQLSWTASAGAWGFTDGGAAVVFFETMDTPWRGHLLGLSLDGTYHEIPGTNRGVFTGTAMIHPFYCSCGLIGEFTLN